MASVWKGAISFVLVRVNMGKLRPQELTMAKQLMETLAAEWKPEKYEDEYRANLMRIIQAKLKRTEPRLVERAREKDAHVVDLMERPRRAPKGARRRSKRAA